jgi:hypothetical protein
MSATSKDAVNLTGVWQGLYSYETIDEPVPFLATLLDTGSFLSGATQETCEVETRSRATPCAMIDGSRTARRVSFTKTYDGSAGWAHSVSYEGTVTADGAEIEGSWILPEGHCGRFIMVREAGKAQEVWKRKLARV